MNLVNQRIQMGGVLEDTNNNQPVNADTTGEDKGQGSTAVSGKKTGN